MGAGVGLRLRLRQRSEWTVRASSAGRGLRVLLCVEARRERKEAVRVNGNGEQAVMS